MQNNYISILGYPFVGKTTVCEYLSTYHNLKHIPLGKLIRNDIKHKTIIEQFISKGKLIPSKISIEILKNELLKYEKSTILIDGFPRNMENLMEWKKYGDLKCVILIECNVQLLFERLVSRKIMECRIDDSKDLFIRRLNSFDQETTPVIEFFKNKGILQIVDGNQSKLQVAENILNILH